MALTQPGLGTQGSPHWRPLGRQVRAWSVSARQLLGHERVGAGPIGMQDPPDAVHGHEQRLSQLGVGPKSAARRAFDPQLWHAGPQRHRDDPIAGLPFPKRH